ncbi:hypothetical protein [Actinoplanes sp. NPDC051859]|uniref:hypothetical protein n=1 Tax=Actinoplanes sp. NPDC051859 TaxID=3363909 RepID=UPI0037A5D15A
MADVGAIPGGAVGADERRVVVAWLRRLAGADERRVVVAWLRRLAGTDEWRVVMPRL